MLISLFEIPNNLLDSNLAVTQLLNIQGLEKRSPEWVEVMSEKNRS